MYKNALRAITSGWRYTTAQDHVEYYDDAGKLLSITDRAGLTQTLTYSDINTPVSIAPQPGLLIEVENHFGRTLTFTYDDAGRLITMTDPQGQQYTYNYTDTEYSD